MVVQPVGVLEHRAVVGAWLVVDPLLHGGGEGVGDGLLVVVPVFRGRLAELVVEGFAEALGHLFFGPG